MFARTRGVRVSLKSVSVSSHSNIRHVAESELEWHVTVFCVSDGVWRSLAISTSGLSETGMFFAKDPTDSELTVRQLYTFL